MMDLNGAVQAAQSGEHIRDDATMKPDWTVRFVAEEKLLYYFNPRGERAHMVRLSDAHRASFQWRTVPRKGNEDVPA